MVLPEVVSRDPNTKEIQGVDYSRLAAILIEAVKSQQRELQTQRRELELLRERIEHLEEPTVTTKFGNGYSDLVSGPKAGN